MKKRTIRPAALLLALICLSAALTACGSGRPGSGTGTAATEPAADRPEATETTAAATDAPAPKPLRIVTNGKSDYRLIYPADDRSITTLTGAFLKLLNRSVGWLPGFYEDSNTPADADTYEILVGNTNRPESRAAMEGLPANGYRIQVTDRKVVLVGTDNYALSLAISEFFTMAHEGSNLTAPAGYSGQGSAAWGDSYPIAVTDQKKLALVAYDLAKGGLGEDNVLERFAAGESGAADLRTREWQGRRLVLSAGGHDARVYDAESGRMIWSYFGDLIWNAHAMELLPCGVLAVAGSTGGNLVFFDLVNDQATPVRLAFADAHGVMWDPIHECLWVIGGAAMKAYRVTKADGKITAEETRALTIPDRGAHDLQPIYGKPGSYWVTTASSVFRFDSNTEQFEAVPASSGLGQKAVKGIGSFADGCVVQTIADGFLNSWDTETVWFYRYNEVLGIYVPIAFVSPTGTAFYKVRVWSTSYN